MLNASRLLEHPVMPRGELDGWLAKYRDAVGLGHSKQALAIRDRILLANMRLVAHVAQRYRVPHGMTREDLLSYGVFGLIAAIEKFDLSKNTQFSTYATYWVRHTIGRSIADLGNTVRVPVHAANALAREPGGKAPKEAVLEDARAARRVSSLDAPVFAGEDLRSRLELTAGEWIDPVAGIEAEEAATSVTAAVERLPEKFRAVVHGRIWDELTLKEYGEVVDLSRERIRQLQCEAFDLLRPELADFA